MDSVESTIRAYFDALNRSGVDGVVGVFAEDATFMGNESETAVGHEQIRRAYEGAFQARSLQRKLHLDEVREGADLAVARAHTTGTITFLADDNVIEAVSRELFVLRKSAEGWQITDYMFNRPA